MSKRSKVTITEIAYSVILQVERSKTFSNIHMDAREKLFFVSWQKKVQALKAFVFYIVTFNDEHTKPTFKRKLRS